LPEILVAVDGSKHSDRVVDFATDLAKKMSYSIVLVHVMKSAPHESEQMKEYERTEHFPDAYADYLQEIGSAVTSKYADKVKAQNVPCRTLSDFANPSEYILERSNEKGIELIVLGLKGLHNVGRIRSLGSVARRVIENASCPVIVVP